MSIRDEGFQVVIDPGDWYRLKRDLDKFDPALARALRTRIRNAGRVASDAVKASLRESSPGGGDDSGEGRAALAAATRLTVSFGKRSAGTRVVTSASRLPAEHKGLLHVYNKTEFRHPLYGMKNHWFRQRGRPYFETSIRKVLDRTITKEIEDAVDEAMRAMRAKNV